MKRTQTIRVQAGVRGGQVRIPPSKSIGHRALICAALCPAGQVSRLVDLPRCEDIDATLDCLRALGVTVEERGQGACREVLVHGTGGHLSTEECELPCRESGSTLRFLLPLCLLSTAARTLCGSERLLARPLEDYAALLADRAPRKEGLKLVLGRGSVPTGGRFSLSGKSSSQFVTGLLLITPLLEQDSDIVLSAPPESRTYIDMTLAVMARFGVRAAWQGPTTLHIPGNQRYRPCEMTVDGDASGAAFFQALSALCREDMIQIACTASEDLPQGDAVCPQLLAHLAAGGTDGQPPVVSLADCPDLGPVLFASAAALGGAIFTHTDRLRLKESDRIAAMAEELVKLGVAVFVSDGSRYGEGQLPTLPPAALDAPSGWVVVLPPAGGLQLPTQPLCGHNDHRIVMSLAVLAVSLAPPAAVTLQGCEAVAKSFPDFFDRLRDLGVQLDVD